MTPHFAHLCLKFDFRLIEMNADTFGYFILILMMTNFVAIILGLIISACAPTVEAANALGPPFIIIGILFGGFYISVDSLPIILNWIPYISLFQWAFRALATNEFKGLKFECDSVDPTQCIATGDEALAALDYSGHTTSYAIFGLGMLMLVYIAALYLILAFSTYKYCPLGHVGSAYKAKANSATSSNVTNASEKVPSSSVNPHQVVPTYKMVNLAYDAVPHEEDNVTSNLP